MKHRLTGLVLCVALALCGCSSTLGSEKNVQELLRAPQSPGPQSAVQSALNTYLGETVQLKYPRGGSEMSPVLFADFDSDGTSEAAVLFLTDSGRNVRVAMLEQQQGAWQVASIADGLSTEVASAELVQLRGSGSQLVLGFGNATLSDKYLGVYDYDGAGLHRIYEQAYTDYLAADFGAGSQELVVLPLAAEPGALKLLLLGEKDGAMELRQSLLLDERFVSCKRLSVSRSGKRTGLVIDGSFSAGGLASQVLCYRSGSFAAWPQSAETDVPLQTLRFQAGMFSADLRGAGAVEVPTAVTPVSTLSTTRKFYFVTWLDYLSELSVERFGVYDAENGYFVRLPSEWKDKVVLADGAQAGAWQVRSAEDNMLFVSFRLQARGASAGTYTLGAQLGDENLYYYISDNSDSRQAAVIRSGIVVLQQ